MLAQTTVKTLDLARGTFDGRLTDIKGNGNDPFVGLIVAHAERDLSADTHYRTTYYGLAGGLDYRWDLSESAFIRAGAFLGHVRGDVKYDVDDGGTAIPGIGAGSTDRTRIHQRTTMGGFFAAYEYFDSRALKTNLDVTLSLAHSKNEILQVGYGSDFHSQDIAFNLDASRNLYSYKGFQFGPWVAVAFHHIREDGYKFAGDPQPELSSNLIGWTVGVNGEREFDLGANHPELRLRAFGRIGACWQPRGRNIGAPAAHTLGQALGDHCSCVVILGFRQKITENWDVTGAWNGDFSGHYHLNKGSLSVGYTF
jgi:hypothetical protein